MPYYSIEGLFSTTPFVFTGKEEGQAFEMYAQHAAKTQDLLQSYRLLASLFVNEGDPRLESEHFGFLTPAEAGKKYEDEYGERFRAYFGYALGDILKEIPVSYRNR